MGLGTGTLVVIAGLLLGSGLVGFPFGFEQAVDPRPVGWVLVLIGVAVIVVALVLHRARHGAPRG